MRHFLDPPMTNASVSSYPGQSSSRLYIMALPRSLADSPTYPRQSPHLPSPGLLTNRGCPVAVFQAVRRPRRDSTPSVLFASTESRPWTRRPARLLLPSSCPTFTAEGKQMPFRALLPSPLTFRPAALKPYKMLSHRCHLPLPPSTCPSSPSLSLYNTLARSPCPSSSLR